MKRMHKKWTRHLMVGIGLAALLLGGGLATAFAASKPASPADYANRIMLAQDVAKLAVVVSANQTPFTRADAQAIIPVLHEIQDARVMTESLAVTLDAKLQRALSPALESAIARVRLPQPDPDARKLVLKRLAERRHPCNPVHCGPGAHLMDRLVEFLRDAAE